MIRAIRRDVELCARGILTQRMVLDFLTLEDADGRLSRNVGNELQLYAA
jgi:hypothetical protein